MTGILNVSGEDLDLDEQIRHHQARDLDQRLGHLVARAAVDLVAHRSVFLERRFLVTGGHRHVGHEHGLLDDVPEAGAERLEGRLDVAVGDLVLSEEVPGMDRSALLVDTDRAREVNLIADPYALGNYRREWAFADDLSLHDAPPLTCRARRDGT
jgi:hypothetical protein